MSHDVTNFDPEAERTARTILDASMSEARLQDEVIETAQRLGWRVAHFRPAKTDKGWRTPVEADGKGFPDLIMLRGDRQLAVELKREDGEATADQLEWLLAFERAGAETYLWFPHDLSSGAIDRVLSAR